MYTRRRLLISTPMAAAAAGAVALLWSRATPGRAQMSHVGAALDQLSGDAFDQAWLHQMIMHHAMGVMMARPAAAKAPHEDLRSLAGDIVRDQAREIEQMRGWLRDWYGAAMPDPVAMMDAMHVGTGHGAAGVGMAGSGAMGPAAPAAERQHGAMTGAGAGAMMGPGAGAVEHQHGAMVGAGGMTGAGLGATTAASSAAHQHGAMTGATGMMGGMGQSGAGMMGGMMGHDHAMMAAMHGMGMMADLDDLPGPRLEAVFMSLMIPHHQDAIDMAALVAGRAAHTELTALATAITAGQAAENDRMTSWLTAWYGL